MREILFRGKRVDNGEWVYSSFIMQDKEHKLLLAEVELFDGEKWRAVDPETVGQYTGARGYDGKRIFEGDIVRFDYVDDDGNDSHEDFLIIFKKGAFRAQYLGNVKCAPNIFDDIAIDEGYVVGNKWDNPELLEVKE